jgi:hypothetical protein
VNKPRDNIFIGSVRRIKMGRNKAFRIPSIAAAKIAVPNPLTWMPSSKLEVRKMAPVNVSHLIKIPFINVALLVVNLFS